MQEIAAEAGVGIATVYRRFARKGDLLRTVLDRCWDKVITPALSHATEEVDPREAMRIAFEGALRFVVNDRAMLSAASEAGLMMMDLGSGSLSPSATCCGEVSALASSAPTSSRRTFRGWC
jgi:AcrR family transcriptional regulator